MSLVIGVIARLIVVVEYASFIGRLDLAGEDFGPRAGFVVDASTGSLNS